MKTSISADVWERKKGLIAKLYMEEEWPLKQVIKQIRSPDFDPSETQLRSRLKKWRVTKPSRQTRKKSQVTDDGLSDKEEKGSSASPSMSRPSIKREMSKELSTASSDWAGAHPVYVSEAEMRSTEQSFKWNPSLAQQLTPSPTGEHGLVLDRPPTQPYNPSPTTTSFEPAQNSPVDESFIPNTTSALTPTFTGYPLSPESCIPSPGSTTATMPWGPRSVSVDLSLNPTMHSASWYPMPFEAITPPPTVSVPHSTHMAPPPGYRDSMPMIASSAPSVLPPQFAPYETPQYPGDYDAKPWKRTMSMQYDYTSHPNGLPMMPDQMDRKHMPHYSLPPPGNHMMAMPATQPGPQGGLCAPLVPYMGQAPVVQKQHHGAGY
ncbi:uncharacterized protein N7483_005523 [Penicillium malachiteum]|uniref:uncharacterized protein n=1 Tax=Penicillium malachiteum TaxID=1324776 RepID=UPI0025491B28|nr:uncharacterized protein N7483_005523 [Penicillium malachiteum]KAJ5731015.1 hypothetical protein N7483_005523 [Penicillium malachiteum]